MIPDAIAAKTHAVNTISHAAATGDDPVRAFQHWLDEAMRQLVMHGTGAWTLSYVRQAADAGALRAQQLAPSTVTPQDRTRALQTLCVSELHGICDAVSQQATRAFGQGLLSRRPTGVLAADVRRVITSVGVQRSHLLASFFAVRAHGVATLDVFRAAGVSRVGTVAERVGGQTRTTGLLRDAKKKVKKKKKWAEPEDLVEVLTAGDDDVCPQCEEISEQGPYTLDEAERLIPTHPRCRCAFIPAWDERYASVRDADWTEQLHPRDKDGKFAVKPGASVEEKIVAVKAGLKKHGMHVSHEVEEEDDGGTHILSVAHEHVPAMEEALSHVGLHVAGKLKGASTHFNIAGHAKGALPEPLPHHAQLHMSEMKKISGKMGSNEGGVYEEKSTGNKYYVKQPESKDHVQNELVAAALYRLAGVKTLNYVPVSGGEHVATELETLGKKNVYDFDEAERDAAKSDFAVHAWLANWDAVGTGGDNVGVRQDGSVVTLDTGGSLKYRAQGAPKGDAFGNKVTELDTLRDPQQAPDAAKLYGEMTPEQLVASISRVTNLSNLDISKAVYEVIPPAEGGVDLAEKLIKRRNDLEAWADQLHQQMMADPTPAPAPQAIEPKVFKTKMEHAKHLLLKGTTSAELKTALGWPSIGVPKVANDLGLKLTKTKMAGGAFHYKGEVADPAAESAAAAAVAEPSAFDPEPAPKVEHDISTVHGNFMQELENEGVEYSHENSAAGHFITLSSPKDVSKAIEIAKWHPKIEKLSAHEYFAAGNTAPVTSENATANFAAAIEAKGGGVKTGKFGINSPYHGQDYVAVGGVDQSILNAIKPLHPGVEPIPESATIFAAKGIKPTTAAVKSAPKSASYTQAELDKAKKTTPLSAQYVPGAPQGSDEADALIAKFNEKWSGKEIADQPHLLEQKVDEFKHLASQMPAIAAKAQVGEAKAKANLIAKQKLAQEAAIKAEADKIAKLAELPEEDQREYWLNKIASGDGYLEQGQAIINGSKGTAIANKLKEAGVTPAEVGFIRAFTGPYSHVNEEMRVGHLSETTLAFKHIMNEALAKMPKFTGDTVWRKIVLSPDQQAKYEVGKIAHWAAFSSTSKNSNTWTGNTYFTIRNPRSGVDVQSISSNPSEAEVIMPADTYYKVLSKKNLGGDVHIELEEVIPFGKKLKKAA